MPDIVARLQSDIKDAVKGGDKPRAGVLRLLLAAVKQKQIDGGIVVDESGLVSIVEKMIKQRRDSIEHFEKAGRTDLQEQEEAEIKLLEPFMPAALSHQDLIGAVEEAIAQCNAGAIKDMGKVMAALKPRLAGRADMAVVSGIVKEKLSALG